VLYATTVTTAASGTGTIVWNSQTIHAKTIGPGASGAFVHSGTGTLTVDIAAGTLDLGTSDNGITVDVAANVTIGDSFRCHAFDGSSGVITGAGKTITVGSGGLDWGAATLNAPGTLNVTVAEASPTALKTSHLVANRLGTLTVNAAATSTGSIFCQKFAGTGALTLGSAMYVRPAANDFWTNTETVLGGSAVSLMYAVAASHSNTADISIGGTNGCNIQTDGAATYTLTQSGALSVAGALVVSGIDAGGKTVLAMGGDLTVGGIVELGAAGGMSGGITMSSGTANSFGGTVSAAACSDNNNLALGGLAILASTLTGTGITVTTQGDGRIDCGGTGRVTAVTAAGRRLVVHRAVDSGGDPVRSWNGDGCTNVRFLGRRVIGNRLRAVA